MDPMTLILLDGPSASTLAIHPFQREKTLPYNKREEINTGKWRSYCNSNGNDNFYFSPKNKNNKIKVMNKASYTYE